MRLVPLASLAALALAGCAHDGPTSDQRLDRDTQGIAVESSAPTRAELMKVNCQDAPSKLSQVRNVNQPETQRVQAYMALYDSLRKRADTFETAMTRNPDLAYEQGSEPLVAAKDLCVSETADVKTEFLKYVRELVEVPTVQEIHGGSTYTVARLDLGTLRQAIEDLAPDDKDSLLVKLERVEKQLAKERKPEPEQPSHRRHRGRGR